MGTACVTTAGEVLWRQQTLRYDPKNGNGGSPVLYQDKLIFHCDGKEDPYVAALNKDTGDMAWRTPRLPTEAPRFSHSTPLLIQDQGRDLLISPGSGSVDAYAPNDGTLVWRVRYGKGYSVIPRPVYSRGLVYIATGYTKANIYAIRTGGQGDVTDTHIVWQTKSYAPNTPSPLLVGNELYFVADNGTASCVDAQTGALHWQEKLNGKFSASPTAVANRIYWVDEDGKTTVTQVGPVFKKLAENALDQRTFASPALSGSALFLRTQTHLYRLEETSPL
jgi:outer membrane protein assembly factor BamB